MYYFCLFVFNDQSRYFLLCLAIMICLVVFGFFFFFRFLREKQFLCVLTVTKQTSSSFKPFSR